MMPIKKNWPTFFVGLALGLAIWNGLAHVTGRREPWDGERNLALYAGTLFAAGILAGWLTRTIWPRAVLGIYLGQLAAMVMRSNGELGLLIPLGLIALGIFTGISALGALMGKSLGQYEHR